MPLDESKLSEEERKVYEVLKDVVDPEFGFSIVEAGFIDEVKVEGGKAKIRYHLSAPFCPPMFALHIGMEIKRRAVSLPFVEEAEVYLTDHWNADQVNKMLREYKP